MGQASSQLDNGLDEQSEDIETDDNSATKEEHSNKSISESRNDASSNRKRKLSNEGLASAAPPFPSTSSGEDQGSRPSKRKRVVESLLNGKDAPGEDNSKSPKQDIAVEVRSPAGSRHATGALPKGLSKQSKERSKKKLEKESQQSSGETSSSKGASKDEISQAAPRTKKITGVRTNDKGKLTGFFTEEEVQALEKFKVEFCNNNGLPADTFNRMVQHSDRQKDADFPCEPSIISKPDFWTSIYEVNPRRDKRSIYRFMRRHFQASTQKPHHWTKEQDEELISLHTRYGPKWAEIAKLLGRSDDDVVQRWKNKLEHRGTMQSGPWQEEETYALQEAVKNAWESLKHTDHDVGKDMYEMPEVLVSWGVVSRHLKNRRSRQQCADKWRKVRRKVMKERASGNPSAVYNPARVKQSRSPLNVDTAPGRWKTQRKSKKYVDPDDENDNDGQVDENGEDKDVFSKKGPPVSRHPQKSVSKKSQAMNGQEDETTVPSEKHAVNGQKADTTALPEKKMDDTTPPFENESESGSDSESSHNESGLETLSRKEKDTDAKGNKFHGKRAQNEKDPKSTSGSKSPGRFHPEDDSDSEASTGDTNRVEPKFSAPNSHQKSDPSKRKRTWTDSDEDSDKDGDRNPKQPFADTKRRSSRSGGRDTEDVDISDSSSSDSGNDDDAAASIEQLDKKKRTFEQAGVGEEDGNNESKSESKSETQAATNDPSDNQDTSKQELYANEEESGDEGQASTANSRKSNSGPAKPKQSQNSNNSHHETKEEPKHASSPLEQIKTENAKASSESESETDESESESSSESEDDDEEDNPKPEITTEKPSVKSGEVFESEYETESETESESSPNPSPPPKHFSPQKAERIPIPTTATTNEAEANRHIQQGPRQRKDTFSVSPSPPPPSLSPSPNANANAKAGAQTNAKTKGKVNVKAPVKNETTPDESTATDKTENSNPQIKHEKDRESESDTDGADDDDSDDEEEEEEESESESGSENGSDESGLPIKREESDST